MQKSCFLFFLFMIIMTGCNNRQAQVKTSPDLPAPAKTFSDTGTNSSISDCSKLIIPKNTEVNTSMNHDKGLLSISWFDETKGKDVTFTIRYTDQDCSESVKQLISHVLKTELPNETPLPTGPPFENSIAKETPQCKLQLDSDFLTLASKGQLKGLTVKIGSSKQDALAKLGKADETGMMNSEYFRYQNCGNFYFDDHKYVSAIIVDGKEIGLDNNQLKEILKKPLSEGPDEENGGYYILYETGNYQLYFNSETKDGVITDLLFKKKMG